MKSARRIAAILLAFLGVSATAGAVPMVVSALRGTPCYLPLSMLAHTPFHSYLVPGVILLVSNGLLALLALCMLLACKPGYALAVMGQGCVLLGWIVVECILLRMVMWLQITYGVLGIALIVLGAMLPRGTESTGRR